MVARDDVSVMGLREVAEHERQFRAPRAAVEPEPQTKAAGSTAAGDKRAPEQQQQVGGVGDNKIRLRARVQRSSTVMSSPDEWTGETRRRMGWRWA